jgi:colicin import membrane protein
MSAAPSTRGPQPPPEEDPFFYGWRDVRVTLPGGQTDVIQVPLTREDALHPQEGDVILHSDKHDDDLDYFKKALRKRLYDDPTAAVFSDMELDWDIPELRHHSPDIMVFFGMRDRDREWHSFDVAQEGVRPALIIEVTSWSTRQNDLETKVEQYFRAGVPFYAIVDDTAGRRAKIRTLRLLGYRSGTDEYEPVSLDNQGRLWLEPVGLWLAIETDRPVLLTRDYRRLETYEELVNSLDAEVRARAKSEEARVKAAKAQAKAEKARAKLEAERDAAENAREEAEIRACQLEEELRRLRGGS